MQVVIKALSVSHITEIILSPITVRSSTENEKFIVIGKNEKNCIFSHVELKGTGRPTIINYRI